MKRTVPILAFCWAAYLCLLYEGNDTVPLWVSMATFTFVVAWGLVRMNLSRMSLLPRVMIVIYALPFIHCYPYLWFDYTPADRMWGVAPNPYQFDPDIMTRVAMVGCIGACALVSGLTLFQRRPARVSPPIPQPTLDPTVFILLAALALFFSWLNAPKETIFEAAYTQSPNRLEGIRFNAAWLLSYVFVVLLYIDTLNEGHVPLRTWKLHVTLISFGVIVIYLQFLRGKRECLGLIFALIALYLSDERRLPQRREYMRARRSRVWFLAACLVLVFVTAQLVGAIRSRSVGANPVRAIASADISFDTFVTGTWTGGLLSVLSVVGDSYNGYMQARWGSTYWDYLLSLPPGPLCQFLGMERPVEATHGPAWEMRYGTGGTHALVVPFMNFKTYGVLCVLFLYGQLLGWLERRTVIDTSVRCKLLYGSAFIVSFFWFWYGEMSAVRTVMAFYGVWFLFLMLPKTHEPARRLTHLRASWDPLATDIMRRDGPGPT